MKNKEKHIVQIMEIKKVDRATAEMIYFDMKRLGTALISLVDSQDRSKEK